MPHGPHSTPSKGRCIYCGDTESRRSREHVVPYALGGTHVIQDASCPACRDNTNSYETEILERMWGDARISANAPSRRKKQKPKEILTGHPKKVRIKRSEYPGQFVFYNMDLPGILKGSPAFEDTSANWTFSAVSTSDSLESFEATYGTAPTFQLWHFPNSFSRMIAKIGYCHVLTELDLDDFQPTILPHILRSDQSPTYLVGSEPDREPPNPSSGYKLATYLTGTMEHLLIIVRVRLIANGDTPTYLAVVGHTNDRANSETVLEKYRLLGGGQITVLTE